MDSYSVSTADNDVRYVPESGDCGFCGLAHESRYQWALDNLDLSGKRVLDFGCGSGYGAYMLSSKAKEVDAIDYSQTAIEFAKQNYRSANLNFHSLDACSGQEVFGPLSPGSYDVIVSFDVIEHLEHYFDYLVNICHLLKSDGTLLIGCPNRLQTFNWNLSWNRYHFQEFSPYQFEKILSPYFSQVKVGGQDFADETQRESTRQSIINAQGGFLTHVKRLIPVQIKNSIKAKIKGSKVPQPRTSQRQYSEIAFTFEPNSEKLDKAFGLIAVCSGIKPGSELLTAK